jgi:hypothetical protein
MKRNLYLAVAALAAASLACSINVNLPSIPRLRTGPTETLTVNEPLPEADTVTDVRLEMAGGELDVSGGAEGLVEGEIRYNVAEWKPTVTNEAGELAITQSDSRDRFGIPDSDVINEWRLKLGDAPMKLTLQAGAYEGRLDLSGLPLRRLEINDGASEAKVIFDSVNPEDMDELVYRTGASDVTLTGLANANFETMSFDGGAGDYTLDFSGELQRDATVTVTTGVSSVRIVIPAGMAVSVEVEGGLHDVSTEGEWSHSGDTYEVSGEGTMLTIKVDMGVGSLTLVSK